VTNEPGEQVAKAVEEGRQRSREAALPPSSPGALVVIWRRHRWKIIAVLFLLLTELCLSLLGGTLGRGPQ